MISSTTLHFKDSQGNKRTVKADEFIDMWDQEGIRAMILGLGFHTRGPVLATYQYA